MFRAIQDPLLSLIYPQDCHVCAGQVETLGDGVACRDCWATTRIFSGVEMLCDKCGALLGDVGAPTPVLCHKCDDHFYDKAVAVGVYEKALAATVIELKTVPKFAARLSSAITNALDRTGFLDADVIVPIPLAKLRKRERGFNQADIIADRLARSTGIAVDRASLTRKLHTPIHRIGMDQKARELTVKNAFEVVRPKLIEDKSILLVDDVLTSGATGSYCAKVLKKSGARMVNVFTLARAVMHR